MTPSLTIGSDEIDGYIPIERASTLIPGRPHRATLWRWISRGLKRNGRIVKLQTLTVGARRYTHPAWIEDFLRDCSAGTAANPQASAERPSHKLASARLDSLFSRK